MSAAAAAARGAATAARSAATLRPDGPCALQHQTSSLGTPCSTAPSLLAHWTRGRRRSAAGHLQPDALAVQLWTASLQQRQQSADGQTACLQTCLISDQDAPGDCCGANLIRTCAQVRELTKQEGFIAHCVGVAADEALNSSSLLSAQPLTVSCLAQVRELTDQEGFIAHCAGIGCGSCPIAESNLKPIVNPGPRCES